MAYIIPTLHPAHILRGAPLSDIVVTDLEKVKRVSIEGPKQTENLVICHPSNPLGMHQSVKLAVQWMDRWQQMRCPVAVDVETSGLEFIDCKLFSIALSGEDGCNTAVAFTLEDLHTLTWDAEAPLVRKVRELLSDSNVPLVFHNAPFDMAVLSRKQFVINGFIFDTQGLAHLVQPDIPHDLGWIGHTYLDVEPWKLNHQGNKMSQTEDPIELLIYNAKDALNTMKLKNPLIEDVYSRGMTDLLIQYQMAFAQLGTKMELWGIPVNMRKRQARGEALQAGLAKHLHWMKEFLNWPEFNPNRAVHVREALFGEKKNGRNCLGLTPTKFTPATYSPSTSYKAIIDHLENPFVKAFVDYVEARTTFSTQFRDIDENGKEGSFHKCIRWDKKTDWGRVFPKWNVTGTAGSRFSSSCNVQNIAYPYRNIYESPPGWVMVGSDKDQLELRIAACVAGIAPLIKELAKPDADPHTAAAEIVYGEAFHKRDAKEKKNLRDMVKNVQYAAIYLGGDKRIYQTIREKKTLDSAIRAALTLPVVSHINKSLVGRYVELSAYHDANVVKATTDGYVEIPPFGRRRYFPVQPPPFTELANWPIQTMGSDYVGMEMVHIQEELDKKYLGQACHILHGHDQLVIECKESIAEDVAKIVKHYFGCTRIKGPAGPVNLTAKVSIGKNLKEAK